MKNNCFLSLLKEITFRLRSNWMEMTLLILQITILFVLVGTLEVFQKNAQGDVRRISRLYQGKSVYQVLDTYKEPDRLSQFFQESNSLPLMKGFYNELNRNKAFQYLVIDAQKMGVIDSQNRLTEYPFYDERTGAKSVNVIQLNQQACDFFHIQSEEGQFFNSEDFVSGTKVVPILMGHRFAKRFQIGDRLKGELHLRDYDFQVMGFLKENFLVYYNGDPEFYLDDFVVMPSQDYLEEPITPQERKHEQIVYLSKINGYIFSSEEDTSYSDMMMTLESISEKSGFYDYNLLGHNPHVQRYRGLVNILNQNINTIRLMTCTYILSMVVMFAIVSYLRQRSRLPMDAIYFLNGIESGWLLSVVVAENLIATILASIFSGVFLSRKGFLDVEFQLLHTGVTIIWTTVICVIICRWLWQRDLSRILNGEESRQ